MDLEAVKYLSGSSKILDNYFMYMGHEGTHTTTNKYEKNGSCNVCSTHNRKAKVNKSQTLKELVTTLSKL
jgi:hypothetical protein